MKAGLTNIAIGLVLAVIGIGATAVSYSTVSQGGGTYVVAWGAIAVGIWRLLLGLFQVLRGTINGEPAAAQNAQAPAAAAAASGSTWPVAQGPSPASTAVLVIGILLIVQALVRTGFLVNLLLRVGNSFFSYPLLLIQSVLVPAVLIIAGVVAGILVLQRSAAARGAGLVCCVCGLLFQLYVLVSISLSSFHPPQITWVLLVANLAIYGAGAAVFARSPQPQASPFPGEP